MQANWEEQNYREVYEAVRVALQGDFDSWFYLSSYPDVASAKLDPLNHYIRFGWSEGRDPAPWFSTSFYLSSNTDVALDGINPFYHYLQFGKAEGRATWPAVRSKNSLKETIEAMEAEFDESFYIASYPDIAAAEIDALQHFAIHGWQEGRNPTPWFSTRDYLDQNPDVREKSINPFYHFITSGRAEGRRTMPARYPVEVALDPNAPVATSSAVQDLLSYRRRQAQISRRSYNPKCLDIHWVIPDFAVGSGGHMTISRIVRLLEFFGHQCTLWIDRDVLHAKASGAYDDFVKHYQPIRGEIKVVSPELFKASGDAIFATGWQTVWPVVHCTGFKEKFYFVQDYEPWFYPRGAEAVAAELTYAEDLACVCAGPWLAAIMAGRYGRWARNFWLSHDPDIYHTNTRGPSNATPRIAFYCRSSTPRRLAEFAMMGLSELARRRVDFHADLFGSPTSPAALPFRATNHGVLAESELARLYHGSDIGICFSGSNYSLVPQEMMACGLPVVEFDNESTRAIFPDNVIALAGPAPAGIAETLEHLIRNPRARARQAQEALTWVNQFSWEKSARAVEHAITEKMREGEWKATRPRAVRASPAGTTGNIRKRQEPRASVIVPTLNGGREFEQLIDRLRAQRMPWPHEIVVIDSGSTDGTVELCRASPDIVFESIDREEFDHGLTRNRAISKCSGEYVAVLTQDALPTNDYWLYNFICLMDHHPNAAGAFGRHVARPGASPFVSRDLLRHFAGFDRAPLCVNKDSNRELWDRKDIAWRQFLFFFSDNNACIRRSVWEKIPYPQAAYGEDQLWARAIIEAGYDKIYSPKSVVYHSHDYSREQTAERAAIEARYFQDHFGIQVLKETPERAAEALNRSDASWGLANGVSREEIKHQEELNYAKMAGYARGLSGVAGVVND